MTATVRESRYVSVREWEALEFGAMRVKNEVSHYGLRVRRYMDGEASVEAHYVAVEDLPLEARGDDRGEDLAAICIEGRIETGRWAETTERVYLVIEKAYGQIFPVIRGEWSLSGEVAHAALLAETMQYATRIADDLRIEMDAKRWTRAVEGF